MNLLSTLKKYCNDDLCLLIIFVFVVIGFSYLFKNQISGFVNFAPVDCVGDSSKCGGDNTGVANNRPIEQMKQQMPSVNRYNNDDGSKVGVELRKRFADPTPSTEKQLNVVRNKPALNNMDMNKQASGLSIQDSQFFRPFDEIWNPGYMPLDLVFGNIKKMLPGPQKHTEPQMRQAGTDGVTGDVKLVLVYAPWCGHSKRMLPDYEKVKAEFNGQVINGKRISVVMYNSDVDKDMVKEYGVRGFPSLFLEIDGSRESFPHRTYDKISEHLKNI
tara:strand:- start:441 stop:1259 length:819 start_codon:yes stop_codon:yes gene_type:complete